MVNSPNLGIVSRSVSVAPPGVDFTFSYDGEIGTCHISEAALRRLGLKLRKINGLVDIFDAEVEAILRYAYLAIHSKQRKLVNGNAHIGIEAIP